MACIELPLRMHLGGNLVGNPLKYEGGTVINWGIDPGVVSHGDLCKMVEEAGEAPLSLPAASIETDEGYNRNNTVDEGKDVSESHVVDEGLSNINNVVGPSEVNSEEMVEANINEVGEGLSPTVERDHEAQRKQEEQRGRGVEKEQVDEDKDDPLDVLWLSDNDDEELQEIRNHYRSFRNQEKGEGNGSGNETDYLDSSDLGSYGSDDDGEVVCKKSKKDYFDPSDKVPSFQLGMIFENSKQFKAALTKYANAKRRARELAKEEINENYKYEFKSLFDYVNALRRADSDGTIDLLVERPTPNHKPSNEGNTYESIPQAHVHSAIEDNVFDVPLTCSTSIPDVPSSRTTAPTPLAPLFQHKNHQPLIVQLNLSYLML
ncbi:hypothetical protein V6N11_013172 [Hibiscus sabdariffa]|uniref:Uncharacterized protein n=1 Tax=Hibiscus sabdariffa TaxID=183260 RepID=A0ABR2NEV8_9ROSI